MKKTRLVLDLLLLYFALIFFYGILIKVTIAHDLLFRLKTYLPEAALAAAALLSFGGKGEGGVKGVSAFALLGALYFAAVAAVNLSLHGATKQFFYTVRDMLLPLFAGVLLGCRRFDGPSLDRFFRRLVRLGEAYLLFGAVLGVLQTAYGLEWTCNFYTGYPFYGVDPYSKVRVTHAMGVLRVPGLTGNHVSFSYYAIFSMLLILCDAKATRLKRAAAMLLCAVILVTTVNKTGIVIFGVIALHHALHRQGPWVKASAFPLALSLGIGVLLLDERMEASLFSTLERIANWRYLAQAVHPAELLFPYNMIPYAAGATGITSFWDNTYLYCLCAFGILGSVFVAGLFARLFRENLKSGEKNRRLFGYLLFFLLAAAFFNNVANGRAFLTAPLILAAVFFRDQAAPVLPEASGAAGGGAQRAAPFQAGLEKDGIRMSFGITPR